MPMTAVVKIGTSSITSDTGELDDPALLKLCREVATARGRGHEVVLVCSGAIAAGLPALGFRTRPADIGLLQAIAAVGQPRLMERIGAIFGQHDLLAGQVLLTPHDFGVRSQYLHRARRYDGCSTSVSFRSSTRTTPSPTTRSATATTTGSPRSVSHLVQADVLVLLTDTPGLFTADPRLDEGASLIEEIVEVDAALEAVAGGTGTARGSGGMASKLAAAKIAAWSGVRAVIAGADVPDVVVDAIEGRAVGTAVRPKPERLASRKLWIAFARDAAGRIVVDDGARRALCADNRSLLPAGVREVEGAFDADDAVEIVGADGTPFAKGLVRYSAASLRAVAGRRTGELHEGLPHEVVHRDDLVVLP